MECNGHSFLGCFLVHLGQKMAKVLSTSSRYLLICMVSICLISLLKYSHMFPISPSMDELEEKVLLPTFLFSAICSRGMLSSFSSLEVLQICLAVHLRVLINHNHRRREKVGCVKEWGCCANIFSELFLLLQGMKGNIFG